MSGGARLVVLWWDDKNDNKINKIDRYTKEKTEGKNKTRTSMDSGGMKEGRKG